MSANKHATGTDWIDPDDAPELTDQFFEEADEYLGDTLVRRGKPKGTDNRLATTIRLDPEIVNFFKAQGAGWQTHINTALKEWMRNHPMPPTKPI
jgi:uncharacterized protein (DUF4415 family)